MSDESARPILVSMGSNIEPEPNLLRATVLLAVRLQVIAASRVFETPAVGARGAPSFLNAALLVRCEFEPRQLKHEVLRPVERRLGRIRVADRNAPRTIDLDISIFGELVLEDPQSELEIPDPEILTRGHVALPLADLAPDLAHPVTGERLAKIAARLGQGSGIRIRDRLTLWPLPETEGGS